MTPAVNYPFKSMTLAILLPLFFGPVGVLYGSIIAALISLILMIIFFLLSPLITGIPLACIWVLSIYWCAWRVARYNRELLAQVVNRY